MKSLVAVVTGSGLIAGCAALGRVPNLIDAPKTFLTVYSAAFACYAMAVWLLRNAHGPGVTALVLAVAALARITLVPAAPTISTDAYRYLWDARVARAGISPYAYPPDAPELRALRDETIFPRINHPTWRTIYPPGAQLFFTVVGAVAPDSMVALKMALGIAELAALGMLPALLRVLDVPDGRLVVYAWNPLLLLEIWGTAHLDALVLPAVVGATWAFVAGRRAIASGLVAAGTLIKLYPAALLSLFLGGPGSATVLGVFAAVLVTGYGPLAVKGVGVLGSLPRYLQSEYFNPGITRSLVDNPYLVVVVLATWIVWAGTANRAAPLAHRAVILLGGMVVLSGNIFPWYVVWLIPFLALAPSVPWIAFTGSVAFAYAFFLEQPWAVPGWARVVEFAPLVAGAAWWAARHVWLRPMAGPTT